MLPEFTPLINDPHRRARLVFTALLHDIGKPETRSDDEGRVHFYQHEVVGAQLAGEICRRLRVSNEDTRAIITIIRNHMRPLALLISYQTRELSRKAMLKFFDACGGYAFDVLALAVADKAAAQGLAADTDVQERLRDLTRALATFYHDDLPARARPSRAHGSRSHPAITAAPRPANRRFTLPRAPIADPRSTQLPRGSAELG